MSDELRSYKESIFESIKHVDQAGREFWYARELQTALEYSQWRHFFEAIKRAQDSCIKGGNRIKDHFADVGKMVHILRKALSKSSRR